MAVLPKVTQARRMPVGVSGREAKRRNNPEWETLGADRYDDRTLFQVAQDALSEARHDQPTKRTLAYKGPATFEERLRRDVERAGEIFGERIGRSDIFESNSEYERKQKIEKEHREYAKMMLASAKKPMLQAKEAAKRTKEQTQRAKQRHRHSEAERRAQALASGQPFVPKPFRQPKPESERAVRTKALVEAIGLGVGMWMVSPGFRKEMWDLPKHRKEELQKEIRERIEAKVESKTNRGKRVGRHLAKRYDKVMQAEQGGHAPYSDHSAALTLMHLSDKYYDAVREPGADRQALTERFGECMKTVYDQAARDGVDQLDIDTNMRYLVGRRMATDPYYANRYSHTAYDALRRDEPEIEVIQVDDINGEEHTIRRWKGGFHTRDGAKVSTNDPGFLPARIPADADEHSDKMAEAIEFELSQAVDVHDLQRIMFVWSAGRLEGFEPMARQHLNETGDSYNLDSARRLDRMFHAFEDDGFDAVDQQLIYANAFSAAIESYALDNPEVMTQWVNEYGAKWDSVFTEMMIDPETGAQHLADQVGNTKSKLAQERDAKMEQTPPKQIEEMPKVEDVADRFRKPSAPEKTVESEQPKKSPFSDEAVFELNDDFDSTYFEEPDFFEPEEEATSDPKSTKAQTQRTNAQESTKRSVAEDLAEAAQKDPSLADEAAEVSGDTGAGQPKVQPRIVAAAQNAGKNANARRDRQVRAAQRQKMTRDAIKTQEEGKSLDDHVLSQHSRGVELTPAQQQAAARRAKRTQKRKAPVEKRVVIDVPQPKESTSTGKDVGPSM